MRAGGQAVIIVGPPWLRGGTGRVIEAQVAYYRARGFRTAFVGVATNPGHIAGDRAWEHFREAATDLRADQVSIAALPARPDPATPWRRVRHRLRGDTALDWIVETGALSACPGEVLDLARESAVACLHVNHVYTLGFATRLRSRLPHEGRRAPVIVETHDIQSLILQDTQHVNPWTGRPDPLPDLLRAEIAHLAAATVLVHLSADDFAFFADRIPGRPHVLAVPGIDEAFVSAVRAADGMPPADTRDLLFIGTDHVANLYALGWFLGSVWPLIAAAGNAIPLTIVGRIDELVRRERPQLYESHRSSFVGAVADLVPYYRSARCVVAPMVSGRGVSIKTIEAFAVGKPFVGTSKAFRGMSMETIGRAGLRAYDDPRDFADAVLRAWRGEEDTGARGRAVYDELCSPDAYFAALDGAARAARSGRRHRRPRPSATRTGQPAA
jgi:glycosyltransferase involved in cell wall biosynthesis